MLLKILESKEMNVDLRYIDLSSLYLYLNLLAFSLTCYFFPLANASYVCLV